MGGCLCQTHANPCCCLESSCVWASPSLSVHAMLCSRPSFTLEGTAASAFFFSFSRMRVSLRLHADPPDSTFNFPNSSPPAPITTYSQRRNEARPNVAGAQDPPVADLFDRRKTNRLEAAPAGGTLILPRLSSRSTLLERSRVAPHFPPGNSNDADADGRADTHATADGVRPTAPWRGSHTSRTRSSGPFAIAASHHARSDTSPQSLASHIFFSNTSQENAGHRECCVTIFGFNESDTSFVLTEFEKGSTILRQKTPQRGNWLHLEFADLIDARRVGVLRKRNPRWGPLMLRSTQQSSFFLSFLRLRR